LETFYAVVWVTGHCVVHILNIMLKHFKISLIMLKYFKISLEKLMNEKDIIFISNLLAVQNW